MAHCDGCTTPGTCNAHGCAVTPPKRTAKDREEEFRKDLAALLKRHKAELDITDDGRSYGMHSGIAVVTMMGEWDGDGNETAEYTEFQI